MEIKIEKGVKYEKAKSKSLFYDTFQQMDVGDSFLIKDKNEAARWGSNAFLYGRMNSKKFSCRAVEGGWRVWRVE